MGRERSVTDLPDRASAWLLALRERPHDAELEARFDDWLAQSPENLRDWEEISRVGALLSQTQPLLADRWQGIAPPPAAGRRSPTPDRVAAISPVPPLAGPPATSAASWSRRLGWAALSLVLLVAAMAGVRFAPMIGASHTTFVAEIKQIRLDDGSVMTLAPNTAVKLEYSKVGRAVALLSGRAFFEVEPDPARPFVVQADGLETRVIGTAFEVENEDDAFALSVREGRVQVTGEGLTDHSSDAHLERGQWLRLSAGGTLEQGRMDPDKIATWRQRRLFAAGDALGEVVEEIDAYFPGVILIRGEELARQPVTGLYQLDKPEEAVEIIALSHGAKLYRVSPWILVLTRD